jgi:predicted permease
MQTLSCDSSEHLPPTRTVIEPRTKIGGRAPCPLNFLGTYSLRLSEADPLSFYVMYHLRHAFRQLLKSPGFTIVAALALALGIGANTAIFSVVHGVLLQPLPFPQQERLLFIGEWSEQVPQMSVSYPNFADWRDRQQSFEAIGAARSQSFNYVAQGEAERVSGSTATHDAFTVLGVPAIRGRLFTPEDDRPGAERTVIIRESFWHRAFGGRDSVIGEQIQLNGQFSTIIGVLPDAFQYPGLQTEIWEPLGLSVDQPGYQARDNHPGLYAIARMKPGVSFETAQMELRHIADQLAKEHPSTNAHQSVSVQRLTDLAFGQVRPMLYILLGAAGFVLLIACANVANLQLARAQGREREFAVRSALGAGRGRVISQLLAESIVLGLLGCGLGLLLGMWALEGAKAVLPSNIPRLATVSLNGWVLAFAITVSLLTSIIFGLVPALHASRVNLRESLAQGARAASGSHRWRTTLIVGEFALTSVLLVGAGLMLRTLANLHQADPGFRTENVVTFGWQLPGTEYTDSTRRVAIIDRALTRLAAVPGVVGVGMINPVPLSGGGNQSTYYIEATPLPEPGRQPSAERAQITRGYFSSLDIALVAGRNFNEHDTPNAPRAAVVDTVFVAKNFGPGVDPIGKRFVYGSSPPKKESDWIHIVGVVAHTENYGLGNPSREQTYRPYTQEPPSSMTFTVRTDQVSAAILPSLRSAMREVAPELPIFGELTMSEAFDSSISTQRLAVTLLGTFAALALVLAALGLYGVLSYSVTQRQREIGIRMALGAQATAVVALIVRHGVALAALGLSLGLVFALGLTRLLRSVLYEVSAFDPISFGLVALVLMIIGVAACWIPARRAARVNPIEALRAE